MGTNTYKTHYPASTMADSDSCSFLYCFIFKHIENKDILYDWNTHRLPHFLTSPGSSMKFSDYAPYFSLIPSIEKVVTCVSCLITLKLLSQPDVPRGVLRHLRNSC